MIATKTKVDISTADLPKDLNDSYFKRTKPEKKKDSDLFSDSKKVLSVTPFSVSQDMHNY